MLLVLSFAAVLGFAAFSGAFAGAFAAAFAAGFAAFAVAFAAAFTVSAFTAVFAFVLFFALELFALASRAFFFSAKKHTSFSLFFLTYFYSMA